MNKQELIEGIEAVPAHNTRTRPWIDKRVVLGLIRLLDEPQPVKVPPFVAVWYEENKDDFETSLFQCIYDIYKYSKDEELNEFENWIIDENTKPFQTLVNMHQFGYEVEKEKRYLVSLKNGQPLVRAPLGKNLYFNQNITAGNYKATRKQLEEAGYGWVFDCPGIEIEEVE